MESPCCSYLKSWIHFMIGAMVVISLIVLYSYVTNDAPLPLQIVTYVNVVGWAIITGGVAVHCLQIDLHQAWETGEIDYAVGDLVMSIGMTVLASVLVVLTDR